MSSNLENYPNLRPSLLLDFANSQRVHPMMQCARASTATCFGPDGRLRTIAANVPRINYDPATGKCRGLLAEEGRTNLLLQSADINALPWSGSAIDSGDLEAGLDGVLVRGWRKESTYGNRQQLLASAPVGPLTVSFIAWCKNRTGSVSIEIVDSTSTSTYLRAYIDTVTGAVTKVSDTAAAVVTATPVGTGMVAVSATITNPAVGARVYLYPGRNDVTDSTVSFFSMLQAETGTFATSYIPTTTAQATRSADRIWMTGLQLPATGYTLAGDAMSKWGGEYVAIMSDNATATGAYVGMRHASYGSYINSLEGARTLAVGPRPTESTSFKFAAAMNNAGARSFGAVDGALSQTAWLDSSVDLSARNILKIGATSSSVLGALWVKRLAFYPAVLTAAQLQRLTA